MFELFEEQNQQKEISAWHLLEQSVPTLTTAHDVKAIDVAQILSPPIHEKISSLFLMSCRQHKRFMFLTDEQLYDIAAEEMKKGRVRWETDIDETPGIYVFISLVESECYKVGETQNLRERITKGHLRYGNRESDSNLIDYCKSSGENWPQCLLEKELVALLFPAYQSGEEDRRFLEYGLQKLLLPFMP